jgi:hypothetical protein
VKFLRGAFAVLILLLSTDLSLAESIFYYTSSPTSWVGHGFTRTMTPVEGATFSGFRYFQQGAYTNAVSLSISDSVDNWTIQFVGPGEPLPTIGDYENAQRWPFQGGGPGLSWTGDGRGDNVLSGNFQVLDAGYDNQGNLVSFAANFVQYDEDNTSWWNVGEIRFNSDVPLPEPQLGLLAGMALVFIVGFGRRRGKQICAAF